jgi:hypothetical protein
MPGRRNSLGRDNRGAVAVEYVMILIAFVIPSSLAISYEGRYVYGQYKDAKQLILLPIP